MNGLSIGNRSYPVTSEVRWRHRFTILALLVTVLLMAWGGFVTTIEAGMAVPDWPSSFGSYDPFKTGFQDPNDPAARWWNRLPILAEHGHRLLGSLAGLVTLLLAGWTWWADQRSWMRKLGFFALFLVIVQGVLGGLRVVFNSLDLAIIHAGTAQLFFATLVAMTLFTSKGWLQADDLAEETPTLDKLRWLGLGTVGVLFVQIMLGALLRHEGGGIAPAFVLTHIAGALTVVVLCSVVFIHVYKSHWGNRLLRRGAQLLLGSVFLQFFLGFTAYGIIVMELQAGRQSALQIGLNSLHLIVAALLMGAAVGVTLISMRSPKPDPEISFSSPDTPLQPASS